MTAWRISGHNSSLFCCGHSCDPNLAWLEELPKWGLASPLPFCTWEREFTTSPVRELGCEPGLTAPAAAWTVAEPKKLLGWRRSYCTEGSLLLLQHLSLGAVHPAQSCLWHFISNIYLPHLVCWKMCILIIHVIDMNMQMTSNG